MSRTYVLKERVARACRLVPADVEFLLADHRAHVRLAPTGRRGTYRVTPAGHVGVIVAPSCRLVIRPKVPVRNLFHLLDPTTPVAVAEDHTAADAGTDLLDFLAARLSRLLDERAAAGLHRAYAQRAEAGPFLQGRLDVAAQVLHSHAQRDRLHCSYEDFTVNVPCNQVPRTTADLVLRCPVLGHGVRAALRRSLVAYADVEPVALGPESFQTKDRLTTAYRPLLDLCRLLAESLSPQEQSGPVAGPSFLLDMERVFEEYVTRGVLQACADDVTVCVQRTYLAHEPAAGQPQIRMRPDLVIERGGTTAVVDAKWKRLAPLLTEDVYQVLAYGTALGARRVALVYPGRRNWVWTYRLARAPLDVEVHTLRVVGTRVDCVGSLERLARSVASPLRPS